MSTIESKVSQIRSRLRQVFSPRSPIRNLEWLVGRGELLRYIRRLTENRGTTILVHGEPRVGKTSLVKIAADLVTEASHYRGGVHDSSFPASERTSHSKRKRFIWTRLFHYLKKRREPESQQQFFYHSCGPSDTYDIIRRALLAGSSQQRERQTTQAISKDAKAGLAGSGGGLRHERRELTMEDIAASPTETPSQLVLRAASLVRLVIIDDFEWIESQNERQQFSALIKKISDSQLNLTLILVAETRELSDLIPGYEGVHQLVVSVYVPPLKRSDIQTLVDQSFLHLGVSIDARARNHILEYSQNRPGDAHRYCLDATEELLDRIEDPEDEKIQFTITMEEIRLAELRYPTVG